MKTAMQELIEKLDKIEKQLDKENNLLMSSALFAAKSIALEFIEKEKEQIIDAYRSGHSDRSFEKYNPYFYEETYNQNK